MFKRLIMLFVVFCLLSASLSVSCFAEHQQVSDSISDIRNDTSQYVQKEVRINGLIGDFFYNSKSTKQRVILLLGGSEGGKSWSSVYDAQNRMDLLSRGYALFSLAYFGMQGLPPTLQSIPLEYFEKAIDWVLKQPGVDKRGVAVMGGSKGGEAALLIASCFPNKVKAVVGLVPASNVFQGLGAGDKSSWSLKSMDMPYAPFIYNENYYRALEIWENENRLEWVEVFRDALRNPEADRSSSIRIEKARCPVFLLSGKKDLVWPSYEMCEKIVRRLDSFDYEYHYEHTYYDEAGHDVSFEPQAWQEVLEFFEEYYPAKKYKCTAFQ